MISVIITTYKRPTFLARAINSVLNQTYQNYEIIVVDDNDAGTVYREETSTLINSFTKNIKYIPLVKNLGACNARNIGLEKALGNYILFLDDDDELLPKHLELLHAQYKGNNKIGVVFSQALLIDVKNKSTHKTIKQLSAKDDPLLFQLLVGANSTSSILFSKKAITEAGSWIQLPFGHENYLMVRIFAKGYKGLSIPESTVNIYFEDTERISDNTNRLYGMNKLHEKIVPFTLGYSKNIQKKYVYNFLKGKVLLNIGENYKKAWVNYKQMLYVDLWNLNNLKFLILLLFPFPKFLGTLNNWYRALIPKNL